MDINVASHGSPGGRARQFMTVAQCPACQIVGTGTATSRMSSTSSRGSSGASTAGGSQEVRRTRRMLKRLSGSSRIRQCTRRDVAEGFVGGVLFAPVVARGRRVLGRRVVRVGVREPSAGVSRRGRRVHRKSRKRTAVLHRRPIAGSGRCSGSPPASSSACC